MKLTKRQQKRLEILGDFRAGRITHDEALKLLQKTGISKVDAEHHLFIQAGGRDLVEE
ncbi:hypothetical protein ACFPK9_01140 [Rubritalea spongiae]|uniref:Uncharacterized protein n=1 Tax=Rubritalea spongiae TaxID=430797 RepID=A0ABW5E204_9BACT